MAKRTEDHLPTPRELSFASRYDVGVARIPRTPSDEDIRAIHPDYPTPIAQVNLLYRDHTARVRAHFEKEIREQVAQEIEAYRGDAPWQEKPTEGAMGSWIDSKDATQAARIARGGSHAR